MGGAGCGSKLDCCCNASIEHKGKMKASNKDPNHHPTTSFERQCARFQKAPVAAERSSILVQQSGEDAITTQNEGDHHSPSSLIFMGRSSVAEVAASTGHRTTSGSSAHSTLSRGSEGTKLEDPPLYDVDVVDAGTSNGGSTEGTRSGATLSLSESCLQQQVQGLLPRASGL